MSVVHEPERGVLEGPEAYNQTPELADILALLDPSLSPEDRGLVEKAYAFSLRQHAGQLRASGAPYFCHVAHVGLELARLGLDGHTVAAGLLHDLVEDTDITLVEIRQEFDQDIAHLVDGVTKISVPLSPSKDEAAAENLRKMLLAMARDLRVLMIKLADRLHNLRTLSFLPEAKQRRIAVETMDVYAALANRLGIAQWKWELEDRCMLVLYPREYAELSAKMLATQGDRGHRLQQARDLLDARLIEAGVQAQVVGRNKHMWSVYQKMLKGHKRFEDLYDLVALRVLTPDVASCYAAFGLVHALWTPLPGRMKDFIAIPKTNKYQSIHTTVVGPEGLPLEVQLRSDAMHRTAERGVAAHWRYKGGANADHDSLPFLKNVLEWQKEGKDAREFVELLKIDLYEDEVFVFTPQGAVKPLPRGATIIDFAYAVHSDVGDHCYGAVVNGKMAPLRQELASGDIVKVLTSAQHQPSKDWLLAVRTSKAKNRIRRTLRLGQHEEDMVHGQALLEKGCRRAKIKGMDLGRSGPLFGIARELGQQSVDDLWAALGAKLIAVKIVLEKLRPQSVVEPEVVKVHPKPLPTAMAGANQGIEVRGLAGMLVAFARCCHPVQGDPILGYVTVGRGVSVHRADCVNAPDLLRKPERLVEVAWAGAHSEEARSVELEIGAWDRVNLMADMLQAIAKTNSRDGRPTSLSAAAATVTPEGIAQGRFTVAVFDIEHLKRVMLNLHQVEGVSSVKRRDRRVRARVDREVKKSS